MGVGCVLYLDGDLCKSVTNEFLMTRIPSAILLLEQGGVRISEFTLIEFEVL
jgi:hypothetical protein